MDPVTMLALSALVGLGKSEFVDKPKEDRARKLAATTEALSPWTRMHAGQIPEADPFGTAMQYGGTALSGLTANNGQLWDKLANKYAAQPNAVGPTTPSNSPGGSMNPPRMI